MSYNSLLNYFKTNFALSFHYKYSIEEIERMMPFERDIYIDLLNEKLAEDTNSSSKNVEYEQEYERRLNELRSKHAIKKS